MENNTLKIILDTLNNYKYICKLGMLFSVTALNHTVTEKGHHVKLTFNNNMLCSVDWEIPSKKQLNITTILHHTNCVKNCKQKIITSESYVPVGANILKSIKQTIDNYLIKTKQNV